MANAIEYFDVGWDWHCLTYEPVELLSPPDGGSQTYANRLVMAYDAKVLPIADSNRSNQGGPVGIPLVGNQFRVISKDWHLPDRVYPLDKATIHDIEEFMNMNRRFDLNYVDWKHFYVDYTGEYLYIQLNAKEECGFVVVGFLARLVDVTRGKRVSYVKNKDVWRTTAVESSKKDKTWEVIIYEDGTLSCDCPAWKYQGGQSNPHSGCKHVKKVMGTDLYVKWQDTHDLPF